jgi:hypothetical protein
VERALRSPGNTIGAPGPEGSTACIDIAGGVCLAIGIGIGVLISTADRI